MQTCQYDLSISHGNRTGKAYQTASSKLQWPTERKESLNVPELKFQKSNKIQKKLERFWLGLETRKNLAIRFLEATFNRHLATALNCHDVRHFFDNLQNVMDQHIFQEQMKYNPDKTGCSEVQKPVSIVAEKGIKQ